MKTLQTLILFLLLSFCFSSAGQDSTATDYSKYGNYVENAFYGGYAFNFGNPSLNNYHIIELGFWKSSYTLFLEPTNFNSYFGNEFIINKNGLVVGPKIGTYFGFWLICAGIEMTFYTDFNQSALRLSPYLGMGLHNFVISVKPQIPLYNKDFTYSNPISLSLKVQLFSIKKEKIPLRQQR